MLLPGRRPRLAALLQVLALLQLILSEVVIDHHAAVLLSSVDEVLAVHAGHATLQLAVVDEAPFLQCPAGSIQQYLFGS